MTSQGNRGRHNAPASSRALNVLPVTGAKPGWLAMHGHAMAVFPSFVDVTPVHRG
jgi:hypothetical protein